MKFKVGDKVRVKSKEGDKYTHTIEDDTIIDGPIERQITYYPPFRKYNREEDYSIVWANFEKRFK